MKHKLNIFRIFLSVLAVFLMFTLLACNHQPDDPGESDETECIALTNIADYTVMRSDFSKDNVSKAAAALYRQLITRYPDIDIDTDWGDKDNPDNESPEILIGNTNRDASAQTSENIKTKVKEGEDWYYVGVVGTKIVLLGSDDANTVAAVYHFLNNYVMKANETSSDIKVPKDFLYSYVKDAPTVVKTTVGESATYVATANVGIAPYLADKTGQNDMTRTIQSAIDAVDAKGGGVVFLPAGRYLINTTLNIPNSVALVGEYVDPDKDDFSKGTILILDDKGNFKTKSAILLHSSSGIEGLTFYYEGQNLQKPVDYYPTVCSADGNGVFTIKNCTFINSYYAIYTGSTPVGMTSLYNVKGTALHKGFHCSQAADICVAYNVSFSPKYWVNAGKDFGAPTEEDIRAYMKENKSVGFYFGDCDRDTYENILLDGFYTGIYNTEMTRAGLSGSYYNLTISDAVIGMEFHGLDTRYGLLVTNSSISGTECAIKSLTDGENASTPGKYPYVNLCYTTVSGKTEGLVREIEGGTAAECSYTRRDTTITYKNDTLYNLADYGIDATAKEDISGALQKALDDAKAGGGGIVYIPAGVYLLAKPVTVGDNTAILGAYPDAQQPNTKWRGTIFLVTYGKGGDENSTAAITVKGDNSGFLGVNVIYRDNGVSATKYETVAPDEYSFFLRLSGKNNFVAYTCFVAASRAVAFDSAENFIADRILMTVFDNGFRVTNCKGGILTRVHTNATYHCLGNGAAKYLGEDWFANGADVYNILDFHLSPRMTLFKIENSRNVQLDNCFHYGAKCYLNAKSSDITIVNGESARMTEPSFVLNGDVDLKVINFMRPNNAQYLEAREDNFVTLYNMNPAGAKCPFNIAN